VERTSYDLLHYLFFLFFLFFSVLFFAKTPANTHQNAAPATPTTPPTGPPPHQFPPRAHPVHTLATPVLVTDITSSSNYRLSPRVGIRRVIIDVLRAGTQHREHRGVMDMGMDRGGMEMGCISISSQDSIRMLVRVLCRLNAVTWRSMVSKIICWC
jgi:hypothetical protein